MSKIVQAFLSGMFFTFILDFFLFLGIKKNYIDVHEINLYYNILFADNQNLFVFLFFSILLGYVTLYKSYKISISIIGTLFIIVASTLITPIGHFAGELLLQEKNKKITTQKFIYHGDIYYDGRKSLYFYDIRFKKLIELEKKDIKELQ